MSLSAAGVMDELAEDDIDILNHEKADSLNKRHGVIPVPMYTSDESVASHFALVTAYEDIKKRLKETERENSVLKKRVRVLEEKLLDSHLEETTSSVGREQVNKAYQAYREASIERDNLKMQLDKVMKENSESQQRLNEQLQSKEVELLQLKAEVETERVLKSLSLNTSNWEIDKLNNALKVHSLECDLENLREECNSLREELEKSVQKIDSQKETLKKETLTNGEFVQQQQDSHSENVQQAYWELKREMSNLHLVTELQSEILRKVQQMPSVTKKVSYAHLQCAEDLERDTINLQIAGSGTASKKRLPLSSDRVFGNTAASCTEERFIPVCDSPSQEHNSYGKGSLDDNSWVFPSPPKPSETVFWETRNRVSHLNFPDTNLDQCNQNCVHKS